VVLVDHSFGANVLLMALRRTRAVVPLLVCIDPAAQFDTGVLGNVDRAIGVHQNIGAIAAAGCNPSQIRASPTFF
jgi:hypothetical protein